RTSICCRSVTSPVTRLAAMGAKSANGTTVANDTPTTHTMANDTATNKSSLAAVYGFQVSVGQFNFPNRVLWEGAAFLIAEARAIRFVFPRAYDVDLHGLSPFSVFEQLLN